jgi:hypothetical protein
MSLGASGSSQAFGTLIPYLLAVFDDILHELVQLARFVDCLLLLSALPCKALQILWTSTLIQIPMQ